MQNPFRTASEIAALPYETRSYLTRRACSFDDNPNEEMPKNGCAVKAVLTATLPPNIRATLESYLYRPAREPMPQNQFDAILRSSGVRRDRFRHLASTLSHARRSGTEYVLADLAALKRNTNWFA
jgi:hypothetical protein